ncbi:MAG: cupredoxin domain-containing protein [Patescibacteria group bacterium]
MIQKSNGYSKRPLWQWILLYLVIGAIVYGLIYYFVFAGKDSYDVNQAGQYESPTTTEQTIAPQEQTVITLTASGFTPANITITKGTTVTWKNESGKDATVNSDAHPTHTKYSPLNLGNFSDGDTLTLPFNESGTYGYHNHFNASEQGTIIVQ